MDKAWWFIAHVLAILGQFALGIVSIAEVAGYATTSFNGIFSSMTESMNDIMTESFTPSASSPPASVVSVYASFNDFFQTPLLFISGGMVSGNVTLMRSEV